MFDFDHWADWLKANPDTLRRDGLATAYRDTRSFPECSLNPCFGIDAETPQRVGNIRFWRVGTCDYQVLDLATEALVADEHMLEANDETVPNLIAAFISHFAE